MSSKKYSNVHYHKYLGLDKILSAQSLRSEELEDKPAHEEMLFIIVHQVYELWFKQILHELSSVIDMFTSDSVDERNIGIANERLNRIIEIQKLLIEQIRIMETMTPLDFLDFRNYLFPASGFQSFQFRMLETLLGLENRITYYNQDYKSVFPEDQQKELASIEKSGSLFDAIEAWLERTPFLQFGNFEFLTKYKDAAQTMVDSEVRAISNSTYLSPEAREKRLAMLRSSEVYFKSVLDPQAHNKLIEERKLRLSYKATISALMINLYRNEPILHGPYNLLQRLMDIDELLTTWRYRHAQMVMRMLGKKIGTGGSSGYDYLHATAVKHHVFTDLHNISTLFIPRSELPALPPDLIRELGFYYTVDKNIQKNTFTK